MARGPATFKQGDLTRALGAAKVAGISVQRFEVDKAAKIVVISDVCVGGAKLDETSGLGGTYMPVNLEALRLFGWTA